MSTTPAAPRAKAAAITPADVASAVFHTTTTPTAISTRDIAEGTKNRGDALFAGRDKNGIKSNKNEAL